MRFLYCFIFIVVLGLYGCADPEEQLIDKLLPNIEVSFPQPYFFYEPEDTVFIKALFSDDTSLRKGAVHIHDQFLESPADTVFVYEFSIRGKSFELDTFWIVNDPLNKNYSIYVEATDKAENYSVVQRDFYQYH